MAAWVEIEHDGLKQRSTVQAISLPHWERAGWRAVKNSESVAESEPAPGPVKPGSDALKPEWVEYANHLGIDTGDLTKAEIIEAVEKKES